MVLISASSEFVDPCSAWKGASGSAVFLEEARSRLPPPLRPSITLSIASRTLSQTLASLSFSSSSEVDSAVDSAASKLASDVLGRASMKERHSTFLSDPRRPPSLQSETERWVDPPPFSYASTSLHSSRVPLSPPSPSLPSSHSASYAAFLASRSR